jgi:hypothetical protein
MQVTPSSRRARVAALPVPQLLPTLLVGRRAARAALAALLAGGVAWLWRAPMVARVISARAKARVRLGALDLHPLRCACTLRKVTVHDRDGRPLFAANEVHLAYTPGRKDAPEEARTLLVELRKPEVVAVFDNALCTQSNWTAWAARFPDRRRGNGRQDTLADSGDHAAPDSAGAPPKKGTPGRGLRLNLNIVDGLLLSLRSQVLGGARIIEDVKLTELDGVGNDLLSPKSTVALIERLSAKAIRAVSRSSIPSEVRAGARAHARAVLREQTRGARALGRLQIKTLRKHIGYASVRHIVILYPPTRNGIVGMCVSCDGMFH